MKIIILGAGQVGGKLAEHLASEQNDVTVIDINSDRLRYLQERLDLRTVSGNASNPNVLFRAGADDADILIALTNSDEVNMIACQVAATLYQTPMKIARVRTIQYLAYKQELFNPEVIPVDLLISPEALVTAYVRRLIEQPDALQVLNFANKKLQLIAVRVQTNANMVGKSIKYIRNLLPNIDTRVVAIYRHNEEMFPSSNTVINSDDEVFFLAATNQIKQVMRQFICEETPNKNIFIAGGGHIGSSLALNLEHNHNVKVIEHNPGNAENLSTLVSSALILEGDATDKELLINENIKNTDIFCSVTNRDEINIMSAMLAKNLGAKRVMSLINRPAYVDIIEHGAIDIAISPHQATIGSLLTHVRGGDIVNVHSLRRGAAEAIEAVAHGTRDKSSVVGHAIHEISLPKGTVIGAVVRGEDIIMGHHDITIEEGDHVIVFVPDKKSISAVETLFSAEQIFN